MIYRSNIIYRDFVINRFNIIAIKDVLIYRSNVFYKRFCDILFYYTTYISLLTRDNTNERSLSLAIRDFILRILSPYFFRLCKDCILMSTNMILLFIIFAKRSRLLHFSPLLLLYTVFK